MIDKALNRAGLIVENDAKERCPVGKTGQLRNSIEHRVQGANYKTECVVGTNLEYAPYVEFGTGIYAVNGDGRQTPWVYRTADGEFYFTVGQKPQPYLLPALEENTAVTSADADCRIFFTQTIPGIIAIQGYTHSNI